MAVCFGDIVNLDWLDVCWVTGNRTGRQYSRINVYACTTLMKTGTTTVEKCGQLKKIKRRPRNSLNNLRASNHCEKESTSRQLDKSQTIQKAPAGPQSISAPFLFSPPPAPCDAIRRHDSHLWSQTADSISSILGHALLLWLHPEKFELSKGNRRCRIAISAGGQQSLNKRVFFLWWFNQQVTWIRVFEWNWNWIDQQTKVGGQQDQYNCCVDWKNGKTMTNRRTQTKGRKGRTKSIQLWWMTAQAASGLLVRTESGFDPTHPVSLMIFPSYMFEGRRFIPAGDGGIWWMAVGSLNMGILFGWRTWQTSNGKDLFWLWPLSRRWRQVCQHLYKSNRNIEWKCQAKTLSSRYSINCSLQQLLALDLIYKKALSISTQSV